MPRTGDQGFALVEVLIAIAITALAVTGVAAVLNQSSRLLQSLRSQATTVEQDEVFRLRLGELLASIPDRRPVRGDARVMSFVAWLALPSGEPGMVMVQLSAGTGDAAAHIRLDRVDRGTPEALYRWDRGPLALSYLTSESRWQEVWDKSDLPRAIRLEFEARPALVLTPRWHRSCARDTREDGCDAEAAS